MAEVVTRLTGLGFDETGAGVDRAIYTPRLTQEQVIAMPRTPDLVGAIVFDVDTEELETYTAAGSWLPILTAGSDINVETITAQTVDATNADLTHIHSHDITNDAVITTLGLLNTGDAQINGTLHVQTNLQVDGTSTLSSGTVTGNLGVNGTATVSSLVVNNNALMDGLVVNNSAVITENLQVDGTANFQTGGVSGDFGVNGNLTAGNLATTGTLLVDGASTLQNLTVNGTLSVSGSSTFSNNVVVNGNTTLKDTGLTGTLTVVGSGVFSNEIFANDVQGTSVQPQKLLYGLANSDGTAPITATLDVGAGTGATCTIIGSNVAGTISIHTGTTPVLGVIATFTLPSILNSLMSGKGSMIMTPGSITTAIYEQSSKTYVSTSTGNVIALFGSSQTALAASTTYVWNYVIIGNQLGT